MESLGIDLKLIIAQLINFGILFFLLSKFAYKPIMNMLDERQKKIEQGLADAEASAKKLADVETETAKLMEKTSKDADQIMNNAKAAAKVEAAELIKKASDQAERTTKNAESEAKSAKDNVISEARKELSSVIVMALDKIVGKELSEDQKKNLTAKAIMEL
ncbi:MAG: F0F1 ATP synthase subunit B [Candidatus Berkelbacteria bacterium]